MPSTTASDTTTGPRQLADFTVLSANIMQVPESEILKTRAVMTNIGGAIVYQATDRFHSAAARQ